MRGIRKQALVVLMVVVKKHEIHIGQPTTRRGRLEGRWEAKALAEVHSEAADHVEEVL